MKNNKIIPWILSVLILSAVSMTIHSKETKKHNYIPKDGYVPTEEVAVKIAVAVWIPIYGAEKIEKEKPYKAVLKNGIWYVSGSLPDGWVGGVAEAEINKNNGCIGRISHGK